MVLDPYFASNTMASYARRLSQAAIHDVEIVLDEHNASTHTYTTLQSLSGHATITPSTTVPFDEVVITLEGQARTDLSPMSPVGHHTSLDATHNFLRLRMPIAHASYPEPRIAEAGKTYRFPFTFVIPDRLLPTSCAHEVNGDHVQEAHLRLPPSLGEIGLWCVDDLSPNMSKIAYAVKVRVIRLQDGKPITLTHGERKIHVIPSYAEAPPLHVGPDNKDYNLCASKTIRKGMFKGKLGQITVTSAQTQSLGTTSAASCSNPTTIATLNLRFDPADQAARPPRLGALTTKIKSWTLYSVRPIGDLPTQVSSISSYESHRGVYNTSITLANRNVEAVSWKHVAASPDYVRRDSGYSTASLSSTSSSSPSESTVTISSPQPPSTSRLGSYEATLVIPLTLPSSKRWLPTFHSCLISRIYSLNIDLSVHGPGTGVLPSTLSLRLPVQISSAGEAGAQEVAVETELDEMLRPRRMTVPEIVRASEPVEDLPPGYNVFARRATVAAI